MPKTPGLRYSEDPDHFAIRPGYSGYLAISCYLNKVKKTKRRG
jgi:hypothetical protein